MITDTSGGIPTDLNPYLSRQQAVLQMAPDGSLWVIYDDGRVQSLAEYILSVVLGPPSNLPQATTTDLGAVRLATSAEVLSGSDPDKAITPSALLGALDSRVFSTTFGDGINDTFTFQHDKGSQFILVEIIEVATEKKIMVDWAGVDSFNAQSPNHVTVGPFSFVPTSNQFRINLYSPLSY